MSKIELLDEEWSWDNVDLWNMVSEGNYPKRCPLWKKFFESNFEILKKISDLVKNDGILYPPPNQVFRSFIDMDKIKVVLLGQDPYHNGSAVGLCFSVKYGNSLNPSLRNIYKELENCGYNPKKNGDLTHWAKQGCMMLNTALTVKKGEPDSHTKIWAEFTKRVISYISENTEKVAWIILGGKAFSFTKLVSEKRGHKFFISSHPSPFSANNSFREYPAFLGSDVFKNLNRFLEKEINW